MMIAQNPSAYYELVNDIDMSNVEWSPIATFSGHFDGKNHKLLNLEPVSNAAHIGLFGQIIGTGETDRAEVKTCPLSSRLSQFRQKHAMPGFWREALWLWLSTMCTSTAPIFTATLLMLLWRNRGRGFVLLVNHVDRHRQALS